MAEALIRGLIRTEVPPHRVGASGPRQERLDELKGRFGIRVTTENSALVEESEVLVLSVKPQILPGVLLEIGSQIPEGTLVISVAAGVSIGSVERRVAPGVRVVRAMPNTPALAAAGATAIARGTRATDDDLKLARFIFEAVGIAAILDETQLDAVTGLSGSGPAYVFLIMDALADAGVKMGLSRRNAGLFAAQTVVGAGKLLLETDEHPGRLKDMVTSPGGTAIAGLHTLEAGGLRTTLMNAVEAATARARELGRLSDDGDDE